MIVALLAIPTGDRFRVPEMSPPKRKEKTFEALLAQIAALAAQRPVLMIFEDVHWIDPTSLELLGLTWARIANLPILLLMTARLEFKPPWPNEAHVTTLPLTRLSRQEATALVKRVTGGIALPAEVLEQILARTDGVPLFVEELTKTLLESGLLREDAGRYVLTAPLPPLAIPSTLHESLMARLDRLAPAREVAQIGAALGRQFSHALISAVAPMPPQQLGEALDRLVGAELMYRRGVPPDAEYTFKHALARDAAYGTLLRSRRQQLHACIANVLEAQFTDTIETQLEVLAHHFTEAGLAERAIAYWIKAGQRALTRSAMAEAEVLTRKGLELLSRCCESREVQQQELELQIALGRALAATKGYTAPIVGETYARARQLSKQLNQATQLTSVMLGQYQYHGVRGELDLSLGIGQELLDMGEAQNDPRLICLGQRCKTVIRFYRGEFAEARDLSEKILTLYEPAHRSFYAMLTAEDPHCLALMYSSCALLCLGHLNRARARRDAALAEARESTNAYLLAYILYHACCCDVILRSVDPLLKRAEEVIALAAEHHFPLWAALGTEFRGWCLAASGDAEEGVTLMARGLASSRRTGRARAVPFSLTLLAEAYAMADLPIEGLKRLSEASDLANETQECWAEAELHRVRGELLRSIKEIPAAEVSLEHALDVARRQSAKLWELRASISLARLWREQNRCAEARDLLAPIYAWFTEGFDVPDLQEARGLLDQLQISDG